MRLSLSDPQVAPKALKAKNSNEQDCKQCRVPLLQDLSVYLAHVSCQALSEALTAVRCFPLQRVTLLGENVAGRHYLP